VRRARLVGIVVLATVLADWCLKAVARAGAEASVFPNPEPFSVASSVSTWVPVLLCAALLCGVAGVNSIMLFAFGLGVGGGLANELESRVLGEVTDFVRPGLLRDAIYAPADLAMYTATGLMIVGIAAWLTRIFSRG
jgi:hypothetical protein